MHELDMEILIVFLSFIPLFLFYEFYSLNKEMHNEIKRLNVHLNGLVVFTEAKIKNGRLK